MRFHEFLGLIIGAVLIGLALFPKADPPLPSPKTPVRILVAKHALQPGHRLSFSDLAWRDWPRSAVMGGTFRDAAQPFGPDGRQRPVVRRWLDAGEPITTWKIGQTAGDKVPPGWRAVSIQIDAMSGVSAFVTADDVVDVILSHTTGGQLTSSVILQGVRVLAVDDARPGGGPHQSQSTVTILVDVEGAQKFSLARSLGRISLILRSGGPDVPEPNFGLPSDQSPEIDQISDFPITSWMRSNMDPGIVHPPGIAPHVDRETLRQPYPPRGYVR